MTLVTPFALTFLLYGPVIPLPYFWDDYPLFIFTTTRSYAQLWTDATGLPYYRPLAFSLHKLFFEALPLGASTWPHACMLALHSLNSVLVGQLAGYAAGGRRLSSASDASPPRLSAALAGSVLYAVYPFAALPVAHFAAVVHALVTLLALGAVLALCQFYRTGRPRFLALTLVAAGLAPYAHEAGVVVGMLASLAALLIVPARAWRRPWLLLLPPVLSGLFLPVWLLVPKTREAAGSLLDLGGWDTLLAKAAFFLQAPTHPVQPLATLLIERAQLWDLGAILLVSGIALLAIGALLVGRRRAWLLLGLGWAVVASLPSIAALPFSYIITSPRLLYLPGVGAALLWAAVLVEAAHALRRPWLRGLAVLALLAITVAVPAVYVRREVHLHTLALTPLRQLVRVAQRQRDERHFVVNTVSWLAYTQRWYPLGHDGVTVLTSYSSLAQLVFINSGVEWRGAEATFPDLRPSGYGYYLSTPNEAPELLLDRQRFTSEAPAFDRVWLTSYAERRTATQYAGRVTGAEVPAPAAYLGGFEDKLYLTAGRLSVEGAVAVLELDWVYTGPDPQATIFRNVFDCAGNVLGLGSGAALGGMLALEALAAGSHIVDVKHIPLESLALDGCYQAEVGLFRADGTRLPVLAPDGSEYPNGLILIASE